mgnify:CR=1 FL=1
MFAEDVGLLPCKGFTDFLGSMLAKASMESFVPQLRALWETMNTGGFSPLLDQQIRHFNGQLFRDADALELTKPQIETLHKAARCDWREVEPSIFGTLLERALDPTERHKLGAHYTPRAYVERLVEPTVIAPLRERFEEVQAAAVALVNSG